MTDATDDIDYGYDGEEEIGLTEDDQELLSRYKRCKDSYIVLGHPAGAILTNDSFTLEELMRLSKLIENEI
jgi:hypothetical protein